MPSQLCWILIYTQLSHTKSKPIDVWWFPQTLAQRPSLDSPTQTRSTLRTHFLPPLQLSVSSHANVQRNVYFSTLGKKRKHYTFKFIKQLVCDYVNALRLILPTVWTAGVHTDCDKSLSFTPVRVSSGRFWLLNRMRCACIFKTERNERENVQLLPHSQTRGLQPKLDSTYLSRGETLIFFHPETKTHE